MTDFPLDNDFEDDDFDEEIRDQFAAMAMSGLLTNGNPKIAFEDSASPDKVAKRAYEFADAMLRARKRKH